MTAMVTIHYDQERHRVPAGRTLLAALEAVGMVFVRGVGCRGGVCGACTILYRLGQETDLRVGLLCQEVVAEGMEILPLPWFPQRKARHDMTLDSGESPDFRVINLYPEVTRCIMCGECSRVCPVELDVMGYVGMIKRGDLKGAARESFTCIQCQACAMRCPARIPQPNAALAARRYHGLHQVRRADHLAGAVARAASEKMKLTFRRLRRMSAEELRMLYQRREVEPADAPPGTWLPQDESLL
ncbi:MAG: 4Fe-4S ferredoxin [Magnetococcales bacterium]|nr:4Fe-4S ferredoxin [Magnetococcales bacterium]